MKYVGTCYPNKEEINKNRDSVFEILHLLLFVTVFKLSVNQVHNTIDTLLPFTIYKTPRINL